MRKKGGLVAVLALIILCSSLVYAACSEDQRIMKLSSVGNAHGEVYDGTAYTVEICYDEIFEETYNLGNEHTCVGNNKVVGLSSSSNAHAETPDRDLYTVDVCYGDLQCQSDTDCSNLGENYREFVSLSAETNAHLASDSSYSVKICCRSPAAELAITGADWYNLKYSPELITTADLNDFVKLQATGEGFVGRTVEFEIWKDGFWFFDTQADSLTSTTGSVIWQASESGAYYFIAKADDLSLQSGNLQVSATESNAAPVAVISSPQAGIWLITTDFYFEGGMSYDEDDELTGYNWDFGDTQTSSESNVNHTYSTGGSKTATLTITSGTGTRELQDTASVDLMLIDLDQEATIVFPIITLPEDGGNYEGEGGVDFDATDSYAIYLPGDGVTVSCLAGPCPDTLGDGLISIQNSPQPLDNMSFVWEFMPATIESSAGATFTVYDVSPGIYRVTMTASISGISGVAESEFGVYYGEPFCGESNEKVGIWFPNIDFVPWDDFENYDCDLTEGGCCPACYDCDSDTGECIETGNCLCIDYIDEEACEDANPNAAKKEVLDSTGKECGKAVAVESGCKETVKDCRCEWNPDVGENGECQATYKTYKSCPEGQTGPLGRCIFGLVSKTDCIAGIRHVEWAASWLWNADYKGEASDCPCPGDQICIEGKCAPGHCVDGEGDFPCLSEIMLSFFSLPALVVAIAGIIVFYVFAKRKEE